MSNSNRSWYGLGILKTILCGGGLVLLVGAGAVACFPTLPEGRYGPNATPSPQSYSRVYHVSTDGGSDKNGDGSADKPWKSLYAALERVQTNASERIAIQVAEGEYSSPTLQMKPYVDLLGGFSGGDWSRDFSKRETLLKGFGNDRVLLGADHCLLEGFTILGGRTDGFGGGILCRQVSPTIANNRFVDNRTLRPEGWNSENLLHQEGNGGGAVACLGSSPVIQNNLFLENGTGVGNGAGILCYSHSSPIIKGNLFVRNTTGLEDNRTRSSNGAAIGCSHLSSPAIENNLFLENHAGGRGDAGGIYMEFSSSPLVRGNLFSRNTSDDDGAAVYLMKGASPRIEGNLFVGNGIQDGRSGTLRLSKACSAVLEGNAFFGNPQGGVVIVDSALASANNTIVHNGPFGVSVSEGAWVCSNDTICDQEGYGIQLTVGAIFPTNTILSGNSLGQIYASQGRIEIFNSIIRGGSLFHEAAGGKTGINLDLPDTVRGRENLDEDPGFAESPIETQASEIAYNSDTFTTSFLVSGEDYSPALSPGTPVRLGALWGIVRDVERGKARCWGNLIDDGATETRLWIPHAYRLGENSPCIDRGELLGAPESDREGDPRPVRLLTEGRVDIGADEYRR